MKVTIAVNRKRMDAWISEHRNDRVMDLTHWDVSKVEDMSSMFNLCTCLEELNISNWNMSNIQYERINSSTFENCNSLTEIICPNKEFADYLVEAIHFDRSIIRYTSNSDAQQFSELKADYVELYKQYMKLRDYIIQSVN